MSIRRKTLLILLLGMIVALSVSTLAYINARSLDNTVEYMLSHDIGSLQSISEAQDALDDAQKFEAVMVSWQDPALLNDLEVQVGVMLEKLGVAEGEAQDVEMAGIFADIHEQSEDHLQTNRELARSLRTGAVEISGRASEFSVALGRMRGALTQLSARVSRLPLFPDVGERPQDLLSDEYRAAITDNIRRLEDVLDHLSNIENQPPDFEISRIDTLNQQYLRHLEALAKEQRQLSALLDNASFKQLVTTLREREDNIIAASLGVREAVRSYITTVNGLRAEADVRRTGIEASLAKARGRIWKSLEAQRGQIGTQRSIAISIIIGVLFGGTVLTLLFGYVLSRGMAGNFEQLLEAAQDIQRGNLDARVRINSRDELRELGRAFNSMARYLKDRREQQIDYNEIVSMLNSSLSIDEILEGSLQEIVMRSGAVVGAFYTAEEDSDILTLAKDFGLSEPMATRKTYRLGAGLVGQAAKLRRKILVSPVPEGAFEVDTGLGFLRPDAVLVLPVVHVTQLLGVFVLLSSSGFSEETLTFIEEVVFQFGVAFNNVRFVETIEQTAKALRERTEELTSQSVRLERVNRELEDANRLKSDFLANVTHELRTPLNSIIGFTELLTERISAEDQKSERHLNTISRNAKSLLGLINDLLDITKVEAGKVNLRPVNVDINAFVGDCLQTISAMVDHEKVRLESAVEDGLPNMFTDRGKLKQILLNLLSNAVKFTDNGSILVKVSKLDTQNIEFRVVDTGIGIHSDDLPFIFDKFRQVDGSSSRKYGGTGLGLTIAAELVRVLGGQMVAESAPDEGSTFIVILPVVQELHVELQRSAAPRATRTTQALRRSQTQTKLVLPESQASAVSALEDTPLPQYPPCFKNEVGPRGPLIVIDGNPGSVVKIREGLRSVSGEAEVAFICDDALKRLEEGSASAVIIGNPLPEPDLSQRLQTLKNLTSQKGIPVIALGKPRGAFAEAGFEWALQLEDVDQLDPLLKLLHVEEY